MREIGICGGYNMVTRRRQWHPTPVLLPGKSHGQRSLVGCSPWGREESDRTKWLHFPLSCIGEGNGNPLQCSCPENPRDRGACWAAVHWVAQSWTRLKRLSSSSSNMVSMVSLQWDGISKIQLWKLATYRKALDRRSPWEWMNTKLNYLRIEYQKSQYCFIVTGQHIINYINVIHYLMCCNILWFSITAVLSSLFYTTNRWQK